MKQTDGFGVTAKNLQQYYVNIIIISIIIIVYYQSHKGLVL